MDTLGVYRAIDAAVQLVGHLSMSDGSFAYDSSYLQAQTAGALSCSLPLSAKSFSQDDARPYFEGLLPEGHARQAIAAALHVREENYLSLLAGYGFECIGDVIIARENEVLTNRYEPIDVTNLASDLGEATWEKTKLPKSTQPLASHLQAPKTKLACITTRAASVGKQTGIGPLAVPLRRTSLKRRPTVMSSTLNICAPELPEAAEFPRQTSGCST